MIRDLRCVRKIAHEISVAANVAFNAYREERVTEEPAITPYILSAIESRVNQISDVGYQRNGNIDWKARVLKTSRGNAAEENRHGADLMGVLDINITGYQMKKGFLVQAKRKEPSDKFTTTDWNNLQSQCEKMLQRTPDSFVWVYSVSQGIRIFPAVSVLALKSRNIFDLYSRGMSSFFEDHIKCFIGDRRLGSTNIETLDALYDLQIENVLELSARQSSDRNS